MSETDRDNQIRKWSVAAGLLIKSEQILLVANKRRNGSVDWTPPGGVIDPGEAPLEALSREVIEETGLMVDGWSEPVYRVEVIAPQTGGFHLNVQVHRALSYTGDLRIDDPDGIVIDAKFVDRSMVAAQVVEAPAWVVEPLTAWSDGTAAAGHLYRYRLMLGDDGDRRVLRLHDGQ